MTTGEREELEEKAYTTIKLSLTDNVLREVRKEKTAKDTWEKLESVYLNQSLTSRLYKWQRFYSFRMQEGTTIQEHLEEFGKIIMDLNTINEEPKDEHQAIAILCSLTPQYKNFVDSMLYGRNSLKLEDVKAALSSAELREKMSNGASSSGSSDKASGLTARGRQQSRRNGRGKSRGRSKSRRQRDMSKVECYKCHKFGHIKPDCPELKAKDKGKMPETADSANVGEGNEYLIDDIVLTATSGTSHADEEWILDSGCSYHMCPHRDWFHTYESIQGGTVLMGNNAACKVIGMGSV